MAAFLVPFPTTTLQTTHQTNYSRRLRTRRRRRQHHAISSQKLLPNDSDPFPVPHIVRQYKLTRLLDRKPPLVIYEAHCLDHVPSHVHVILKALPLTALPSWHMLDHLNYEARILERLHHPSVLNFVDRFDEDLPTDRVFILVTSKPPGIPLSNLSQPYFQEHSIQIFNSALNVLAHFNSHHNPIVHANLNPHNIFIDINDNHRCTLVNFAPPTAETIREPMDCAHDCAYVTPDSIKSGVQTHEDDVYALAVTILQCLTGQSPHEWHHTHWNTPAVCQIWPPQQRRHSASLYRTIVRILHPFRIHRVQTATQALRLLLENFENPSLTFTDVPRAVPTPSSPFVWVRDDEAATLQIAYAPMHLTQRAISSALFTLVWTALSLSITVTPTTAIIPRLVGGAFTYLGLTSGYRRWQTVDMHMKFIMTICPLEKAIICTIENSFPKTGDVDTSHYRSSTRLRAAVQVESNSEDNVYAEFLCISDEGGIRRTIDLPLSRSDMFRFRDEVNHFIESHIPT